MNIIKDHSKKKKSAKQLSCDRRRGKLPQSVDRSKKFHQVFFQVSVPIESEYEKVEPEENRASENHTTKKTKKRRNN